MSTIKNVAFFKKFLGDILSICSFSTDFPENVQSHNEDHGVTHHFGFKWRLDLSVCQAVPVDASEEGLLPDVHLALRATAETLRRMLGHQLATNRSGEIRGCDREKLTARSEEKVKKTKQTNSEAETDRGEKRV